MGEGIIINNPELSIVLITYLYLLNPLLGKDMTQGQFLSRV